MKVACLSIIMLFMLSFQMKGQEGFVKYQTFDEYKMEGVGKEKIKRPYVLVKKEKDVIFVKKIKIEKNKNRCSSTVKEIKYINKGNYWHIAIKPESKKTFSVRLSPCIPIFYEKIIFNDTIVEYQYSKNKLGRFAQYIYVHTKKDCIILSLQDNDIKNYDDPYNEIREFIINYKKVFPLYSQGGNQPRYSTLFEKHIKGDILSIYETDGENKKFISSKKMNSLGEFDNKGTMAWWW